MSCMIDHPPNYPFGSMPGPLRGPVRWCESYRVFGDDVQVRGVVFNCAWCGGVGGKELGEEGLRVWWLRYG